VAFGIHRAIAADPPAHGVALAVSGPEVARFLDRTVLPRFASAGAMMQMAGRQRGEALALVTAALGELAHALRDTRRLTASFAPGDAVTTFDALVEPVAGTLTADVIDALAPLAGDWPAGSALRVALDPERCARALERLANELEPDDEARARFAESARALAGLARGLAVDRVGGTRGLAVFRRPRFAPARIRFRGGRRGRRRPGGREPAGGRHLLRAQDPGGPRDRGIDRGALIAGRAPPGLARQS
jgi:hypothetical protein